MEAQPSHRECFFLQILVNFQSFRLPRNLSLEVNWPDMNFLMPLLLNRSIQFLFPGIEKQENLQGDCKVFLFILSLPRFTQSLSSKGVGT